MHKIMFGQKIWKEESSWKIKVQMGGYSKLDVTDAG
jgi:hypothetical protein